MHTELELARRGSSRLSLRGILQSAGFWLLVVPVLVTAPLVYSVLTAPRIVEVIISPSSEDKVRISPKSVYTKATDGAAYFDFSAELRDESAAEVLLRIRPVEIRESFDTRCITQDWHVRCLTQLGSAQWPLSATHDYSFQLVRIDSDQVLTEGRIVARVDAITAEPPWLIVAVGVLASVIQFFQTVSMVARHRKG